VIVERPAIERDEDVITPKTGTGLDPDDLRVRHLVALQECISQNVARATREKHGFTQPQRCSGFFFEYPWVRTRYAGKSSDKRYRVRE